MHRKTLLAAPAAIAILLAAAGAGAKDWTTVRIATEGAYPPFNYVDASGELGGFDVDIGKALCAEMKVECTFVAQEWDGIIPGLLAEKYDAIVASMSITDERKQVIDFSDKYYNTPPAIAVPKDSGLAGTTPEDLGDSVIGAQSSTTFAIVAEELYPDADVRLYPSAGELQLDLANGRLDAAIDDVVVVNDWVSSEAGACCRILGTLTADPAIFGPGIGVGVRKEDTDLRDMFSAAIAAIRANGVYEEINAKYFPFDVYGD